MRIQITLCLCLLLGAMQAQKLDHRLGYILVQVQKESALPGILSKVSSGFRSQVQLDQTISTRLGIYLIKFDFATIHEGKLLTQLRENKDVTVAQFDHLTSLRSVPDDPRFVEQWQWFNTGQTGGLFDADTDADLAWDVTQGGVTSLGDTIVVAVVDDGIDNTHEDLTANVWINYHEIPNNNVDDDDNGYIDDVNGWNAYDGNPDVFGVNHGIMVSGMIGAVGNNGVGITGMNWNVKIMMIVGGLPESSAIASYSYALEQRILYEKTHGERGAFVVATNSSWGINWGQPSEAPLWCAFYDSLGMHGILSAAATSNSSDNIDIVGDLPTACPSEYLLSVTALNSSNQRIFSAYGVEHVDFGAPGDDVYTIHRNDNYGTDSGTSFASPAAAGLVALLYAAPCPTIASLSHTDPALAAQRIRDFIFNGVEPDLVLATETKYGGSMNAGNSMQLLMDQCSVCPLPISVSADHVTDTEATLHWDINGIPDLLNARIQTVGSTDWDTISDISQPFEISGLIGCTEYLVEFESLCQDTSTGFLAPFQFKTDGCCEIPAEITAVANESSALVSWSYVLAANYFLVQWRLQGDTEWMEVVTSLQEVTLDHLEPCAFYEYRLQTSCDTSETGFSAIGTIRTRNCGNCIDLAYCEASSDDASLDFIDSLIIGPLVNHSGQSTGYVSYESFSPEYIAGSLYPVWSRPGFTEEKFYEQYRIWLDANQDGVFDDDELLLDERLSVNDTFLINEIIIPSTARSGSTRMRVSMASFDPPFSVNQEPCGAIETGEIEDYCVNIARVDDTCPEVESLSFDAINFTSAFAYWPSAQGAIAYTYRYREVGETDYSEVATVDTTANIVALSKCKSYEVQIRTVCLHDTTSYDTSYILETDCDMVAVKDEIPLLSSFDVFPNPTSDFVQIRLKAIETGEHRITMLNSYGQILSQQKLYLDILNGAEMRMDELNLYPPGLYFIMVEKDGITMTKKVIKI